MLAEVTNSYRRPGSLGTYSVSHLSGTMAAGLAAASEILQFRYVGVANTTRRALIHSVTLNGLSGSATAFTAGFGKVDLVIARAWTVDGGAGTVLTLTGDEGSLRTSNATPVATIRASATAACTAGTKVLDTQPAGLHALQFGVVVSVNYVPQQVPLFDELAQQHPIILAAQEGFVVRATVPATGTWQFGLTVRWSEVESYT
jgi:hypothetical protein